MSAKDAREVRKLEIAIHAAQVWTRQHPVEEETLPLPGLPAPAKPRRTGRGRAS